MTKMEKMNDTINDHVRMIHWDIYITNNVLIHHKLLTQLGKTFRKYACTTVFGNELELTWITIEISQHRYQKRW